MQPESFRAAEAIFAEALCRKEPEVRRRYIEEACGNDSSLLQCVRELLEAHEHAGGFLEQAGATAHAEDPSLAEGQQPPGHYAAMFFRLRSEGKKLALQEFIESVPSSLRHEVRERIEALEAGQTTVARLPEAAFGGDLPVPEIPGFRIVRKLGQGGLGAVYLAEDLTLQRQVALKVVAGKREPSSRVRILEEARKAASLRHPAIVTIYSVHDAPGGPAISMELVEGFPIDRATASLTYAQRAGILQEIAGAIAAAHRHGIIHRDLKPENVLVTPDLRPKVLDFGLAMSVPQAGASPRYFEGTPRYASPEQIAGKPLTPASDIFSFGSLMFKVLTGHVAFSGETMTEVFQAICTSDPPFLRDVAVGVPEELQAICLACLAWNPEDRPSAQKVALELGRYLAGEPVRLRPVLYGDILRRRISEYSGEVQHWERQGMISSDEKDRLDAVHRRILADEDHWIIDARKVSPAQAVLYTGTWLVVVAAILFVWLVSGDSPGSSRWLAPLGGTLWLLGAGLLGSRRHEPLACASFLAGAILSIVPTTLALLREANLLNSLPSGVTPLLPESFSNAQILVSCSLGLGLSLVAWRRFRMTGFAWTTATLGALTYWSVLLCWDWLGKKPDVRALWLVPLIGLEAAGWWCERIGRVRWALPFHWLALATLVGTLDVMAAAGPTLAMIGITPERFSFFTDDRQRFLSLAANGYVFLALMLVTERARSLDLRRASRVLEPLALLHILGALYANAQTQRDHPHVLVDVGLYAGSVLLLLAMGPWRSRWRILVGALGGLALGSHLLIDLNLVPKSQFTIGLGLVGLLASAGTYLYLLIAPRTKQRRLLSRDTD